MATGWTASAVKGEFHLMCIIYIYIKIYMISIFFFHFHRHYVLCLSDLYYRGGPRAWAAEPRRYPSTRSWRWRGSTSYDPAAWEALWRRSAELADVKTI